MNTQKFNAGDAITVTTVKSSNGVKTSHVEKAVVILDNDNYIKVKAGRVTSSYEKSRFAAWEILGFPVKFALDK